MTRPRKLWQASRHLINGGKVTQIELTEHPTRESLCVISLQHPDFIGWRGFSLTQREATELHNQLSKWLKEPAQ